MDFNVGSSSPPELITFDEQVVACEVEIDTFDVEEGYGIGEEGVVEHGNVPEEEYEGQEEGGPSGYEYQYEEDPNHVYLFDEDTSEIHKLDRTPNETQEIDYYKEDEEDPSIPSTSDGRRMPTVPPPVSTYRNTALRPNTYYIRRGTQRTIGGGRVPMYGHMSFQTTITHSVDQRGKRVMTRTHVPLTTEDMETMMENTQVMSRIQQEISVLKKSNEMMKKTYEESHRRYESMNMVLAEAKIKQKEAVEEKRQLQREITIARTTNNQLSRKVQPPHGVYRFSPHHQHHNSSL